MLNIIKRLLTSQMLSVVYAFATISVIDLIARVPSLGVFIIFYLPLLGVMSFYISRKFLDKNWIDIVLIGVPYIIYCALFFFAYGILSPIDVGENNYLLVITILFGVIGSLFSIIISMFIYKASVSTN